MIIGIGTDIIEIHRIEQAVQRTDTFLKKVFTSKERTYYEENKKHIETLAGFFAAKEAVSKALGTGFRTFTPKEIEILPDVLGKPNVTLYDNAQKLANTLNITQMYISISHCKTYATAFAVAESRDEHHGIINK